MIADNEEYVQREFETQDVPEFVSLLVSVDCQHQNHSGSGKMFPGIDV